MLSPKYETTSGIAFSVVFDIVERIDSWGRLRRQRRNKIFAELGRHRVVGEEKWQGMGGQSVNITTHVSKSRYN